MRFSILCAHQIPRPWDDGAERRALRQALEQVELADRLGFHGVWALAHHFHEEHAHSSAPEVFLAAAAARTERIRLGLANVAVARAVQHPACVAEAVATLDVLSDGRVDLGTTELDAGAEVGGFGLARAERRAAWRDGLGLVARMLAERPFTGVEGSESSPAMPPRNVVPKPLQRPHPPLWLAGTRRETARAAGEHGLGALHLGFLDPDEAAALVNDYEAGLASEDAVALGAAVTAGVAVALPLMVHADEAEAIERGIDGAHFHAYAQGHYEAFGEHHPGRTAIWDAFLARRDDVGLSRSAIVADGAPLSVRVLRGGLGSLRGAVGTPEQVRDLLRRYEEAGVDEVVLCVQTGRTRHEHACEALEVFAAEVAPAFVGRDRRDPREVRRAEAARAALDRRPAVPVADPDYAFGPQDERSSAAQQRPDAVPRVSAPAVADLSLAALARRRRPRAWARRVDEWSAAAQQRGEEAFRRFVASSDERRLERTIGSPAGLRAMFTAMARRFDPQRAQGFAGAIQYDLRTSAGEVRSWTVTVALDAASARAGTAEAPDLTLTLAVADFARVAAGELDPVAAVLTGRLELQGDFGVAMRLGEMFGQA